MFGIQFAEGAQFGFAVQFDEHDIAVVNIVGGFFEDRDVAVEDPGIVHPAVRDFEGEKFTEIKHIFQSAGIVIERFSAADAVFFVNGDRADAGGAAAFGAGPGAVTGLRKVWLEGDSGGSHINMGGAWMTMLSSRRTSG